jgi:hypothetical protein
MLGAERLLIDRQRPLIKRPRRRKVALVLKQTREVGQDRRRIGMLGTERLLPDRQRPLEERPMDLAHFSGEPKSLNCRSPRS